jgi:aminoglycoside 2''-phosphotransferase
MAHVSEELAREAIAEVCPELKIRSIHEVESITNQVFLVNNEFAFRFARDSRCAEILTREMDVLSFLARRITVQVPNFICRGVASTGLPFGGCKLIKGEVFESIPKTEKNLWGRNFGKFLAELREIDLEIPKKLGVVVFEIECEAWLTDAREFIYPEAKKKFSQGARRLEKFIESSFEWYFSKAFFKYKPSLLHGDIESQHIFWNEDTEGVQGVIDWGAIYISDPDYDLVRPRQIWGDEFFSQVIKALPETMARDELVKKLEFFDIAHLCARTVCAIKSEAVTEIDWIMRIFLKRAAA